MDSLQMYGSDTSSGSDDDPPLSTSEKGSIRISKVVVSQPEASALQQHSSVLGICSASAPPMTLPPPPEDLLTSALPGSKVRNGALHGGRIRSFPHVEGNYALHVYIPVTLPSYVKNEVVPSVEEAIKRIPGLQPMEEGSVYPSLDTQVHPGNDTGGLKLSREYHISLSRTVPIRIHQIETITSMLRHKFLSQKRFMVDFGCWTVFRNDEGTRTFLSLEITTGGLSEIHKQVLLVDEVFKLHNLPTFYKNARPHISLAWALGEVTAALDPVIQELNTSTRKVMIWSSQVRRIHCKIGQRVYQVWTS